MTSVLGTMSDLHRLGNWSLASIRQETRRRSKLHSTAQEKLLAGLLVFPDLDEKAWLLESGEVSMS
jgi:hypothetical protein